MEHRIEYLPETKLVGQHITTTFAEDRTFVLWRAFMPRRKEIKAISPMLFSMQLYPSSMNIAAMHGDNLHTPFEKWAAVPVSSHDDIPAGMEGYVITGGMYAVFHHKGPASDAPKVFGYIFGVWLPGSGYTLDSREYFELLTEKYKPADADSEEEIWIPVVARNDAK